MSIAFISFGPIGESDLYKGVKYLGIKYETVSLRVSYPSSKKLNLSSQFDIQIYAILEKTVFNVDHENRKIKLSKRLLLKQALVLSTSHENKKILFHSMFCQALG